MIEYHIRLRRNDGAGEKQLVDYKSDDGSFVGNVPISNRDNDVIEACKGLMEKLGMKEAVFDIKGRYTT